MGDTPTNRYKPGLPCGSRDQFNQPIKALGASAACSQAGLLDCPQIADYRRDRRRVSQSVAATTDDASGTAALL
jgi:hypothetical protein